MRLILGAIVLSFIVYNTVTFTLPIYEQIAAQLVTLSPSK